MEDSRPPHPPTTSLIARLLNRSCADDEAAGLWRKLAQSGRLLRLLRRAPHHRIGPALAARVRMLGTDQATSELRPTAESLESLAARCRLRNQLLRGQLEEAVAILAERGIRPCLIKGTVSLADDVPDGYLPPAVRWMEDLDVVVRPSDGEAARRLIAGRGWLAVSGTQPVPFRIDGPALVDVHVWSPNNDALGFLDAEEFFGRAAETAVGGREVFALEPELAVQLRLVHNVIRQHLFIDAPLLDLYEAAEMIFARPDAADWCRIRGVGLMHDVSRIVYALLLRLREEFGAPVPEDVIPAAERRAAGRVRRLLEEFSAVPDWLYCSASRSALISATPGRMSDRLNRAGTVLISEPLEPSRAKGPLACAAIAARMLALHAAFRCWKVLPR